MKHNIAAHNAFINPHPDAYFLNESDANVFKQNMAWDRDMFKTRMKYNIPEVEDVQEQMYKSFWSMIPVFVLVGYVGFVMLYSGVIDPKRNLKTYGDYIKIRQHQILNGDSNNQLIPLARPYYSE